MLAPLAPPAQAILQALLADLVRAGGPPVFAVLPARHPGRLRHMTLLHGQDRAGLQDRLGALADDVPDDLRLEVRLLSDGAALAVLETQGGAALPIAVALPDDGRAHPAARQAAERLGPGVHRLGWPEDGASAHRRLALQSVLDLAQDVPGPRHRLAAVVGPNGAALLAPTSVPPERLLHAAR